MAESVLKLRVQSDEYENKLKRATEQLARYADGCRKAGGTLQYVDDNVVEFTRSLGRMETTATTARGKVSELTKSYTELAVRYKNMTDEEKKGEYGKALAASLDQLKGRIQDSKSQLDEINKSINGGGGLTGALDTLAGKFGMSIQSLAGWGTALAAAKGALDVAKDAFFASEATVDEWGRVMDSSKSLYEGFLTALNTGDISGYLSRIDSIVQAARTAYNELDRLGTMKTIQAPQMSAQQTENERMRMMIQTGHYIAPIDGRKASMQNGQLLTPDQIKRIEQQLQGGMQKVVTLVGNEVAQTGRAIDAVYNRQAQELGISLSEFRKGTSSMAEFDKRMAGYDQYQKWRAEHTTIDIQSGRETVARGNPFEQFAKWGTFRVDGDRYNDLVKLIQQRDQQAGSLYGMQSQAYRTMNRADGVTLRQIMGGGSGGGRGTVTDPSESIYNQFRKAMAKSELGADKLKPDDFIAVPSVWENYADGIKGTFDAIGDSMSNLTKWTDQIDPYKQKMEELANAAKQQRAAMNMAGQAVSNFGAALTSIDDPSAKAAGTVMQAIASIALGFATASANANTAGTGWGWLAWVAAGMAAMATAISTVHSLTGYAEGGMVSGNQYSGDNIPIMANAGEVVLNKAMQSNLAQQLESPRGGGGFTASHVSGEQIWIALNAYTKRSGQGEIVTWR